MLAKKLSPVEIMQAVFRRIREARPGIACTTPITAAIAGMQALGCRRVALLTPYIESVNRLMRDYLQARGLAVPAIGAWRVSP